MRRQFGELLSALRREGADPVRKGRPRSLPWEDRVFLGGLSSPDILADHARQTGQKGQ